MLTDLAKRMWNAETQDEAGRIYDAAPKAEQRALRPHRLLAHVSARDYAIMDTYGAKTRTAAIRGIPAHTLNLP